MSLCQSGGTRPELLGLKGMQLRLLNKWRFTGFKNRVVLSRTVVLYFVGQSPTRLHFFEKAKRSARLSTLPLQAPALQPLLRTFCSERYKRIVN